ncbi:hypothetical protein [Craurococcus roseus]|uniref:hypothetical protein n=1 Tax=Craurococcus roseus TaxID=77585 RepID=UPI0031D8C01E
MAETANATGATQANTRIILLDPAWLRFTAITFLIVLIGGLFLLLLRWYNKIEQSGYFAGIYGDAVRNYEHERRSGPIREKWLRGVYVEELLEAVSERAKEWSAEHKTPRAGDHLLKLAHELDETRTSYPKPSSVVDEIERSTASRLRMMARVERLAHSGDGFDPWRSDPTANPFRTPPPGLMHGGGGPGYGGQTRGSDQDGFTTLDDPLKRGEHANKPPEVKGKENDFAERLRAFQKDVRAFEKDVDQWVDRASACVREWYRNDLAHAEREASDALHDVLEVDFSAIRGRGPEFILEFTTIVIIIFAATILGLGAVLDSQQIGTLLAAIAGYVLGKGVSRSRQSPGETRALPSPTQAAAVAEGGKTRAVAGKGAA